MNTARIAYSGLIQMHAQECSRDGHFLRTREFSKDRSESIDKDLRDIGEALRLKAHDEIKAEAARLIGAQPSP